MKKIIVTLLVCSPMLLQAQQNFEIKGKAGNWNTPAMVYLTYMLNDNVTRVTDSAKINNGVFYFKGTIPYVINMVLVIDYKGIGLKNTSSSNADYTTFYLEKGIITITSNDSIKNALVTGSAVNDESLRWNAIIAPELKKIKALEDEANLASPEDREADSPFMKEIMERVKLVNDGIAEIQKKYIKANPSSYFSLQALKGMADYKIDGVLLMELYNGLSTDLKNSLQGKALAKQIDILSKVGTGLTAPVFTLPNEQGKMVSLTDFKGKYVLLNFWASWAHPTRLLNPDFVNTYSKFHARGFEILNVSIDDSSKKNEWMAAIKEDKLNWVQLNDFKGAKTAPVELYGVSSIPQNFLISPDGKIVAINLFKEELDMKLEALMGK